MKTRFGFLIFFALLFASRVYAFDSVAIYSGTLDLCEKFSAMSPVVRQQWLFRGMSPSSSFHQDVMLPVIWGSSKETFSQFTIRVPSAALILMQNDSGLQKALAENICSPFQEEIKNYLESSDSRGKIVAGVAIGGSFYGSSLAMRGAAWLSPWAARILGIAYASPVVVSIYQHLRGSPEKVQKIKQCGDEDTNQIECVTNLMSEATNSIGSGTQNLDDVNAGLCLILEEQKQDVVKKISTLPVGSAEYKEQVADLKRIQNVLDITK